MIDKKEYEMQIQRMVDEVQKETDEIYAMDMKNYKAMKAKHAKQVK